MRNVDGDADLLAAAHGALGEHIAVAANYDARALAGHALIVETIGDILGLAHNTETRRGDDGDAAVALIAAAGDQRMHRRVEADRGRIGGNVMHAPISDQECAGDAIRRHIGQRRCDGGEQFGAVSLAIRLTGLDHAHFKPFDVPQPGHQRFARLLRFAGAFAEILAWAFIDDDSDDRR